VRNWPRIKKMTKRKRELKREILIGLCLAFAACLFMVLLLEGLFRVTNTEYMPHAYNNCTGFTLVPDSTAVIKTTEYTRRLSINSEGFRDFNHEVEKKPGTYRILMLGDSFTEGAQVEIEERYAQRVAKILSNRTGKDVEVITLALGGYGTDQEFLAMQCYGLKYDPDLVVLNVLTSNDISESSPELNSFRCKGYFSVDDSGNLSLDMSFTERCNNFSDKAKKFIGHHSRLVYFAVTSMQRIGLKGPSDVLPPHLEIYRKDPTPDFERGWERVELIAAEARRVAEDDNTEFMVVILTNPHQLSWNKTLAVYPQLNNSNYAPDAPDKRALEMCRRQKLDCISLFAPFYMHKQQTGEELHLEIDGHWNLNGNMQAAKLVSAYILQKGYI
jgi:hypothetical protein